MDKFGRYEIIAELGRGGMAHVYHAHDPQFEREVAVKVLPREFLHDPQFRARFQREARALAALQHRAIVPVYDIGEEDGQPFLVMSYLTGGSLADRIAEGPISLPETIDIVAQIAPALDYAHQRGMIHRDLKPGNILFDGFGDAYLSDFGIVRLSEATSQLTGKGMLGTPAYMAPELADNVALTPLIDIYALGVTVFQMLSGKLPYEAPTPIGLMTAHVTKPIPNIREFNPLAPPGAQTVIERAMAKDPRARYQSAGELSAGLQSALTGAGPAPEEIQTVPMTSASHEPSYPTATLPMDTPASFEEEEAAQDIRPEAPEPTAYSPTPPVPAAPARSERRKGTPLLLGAGAVVFITGIAGVILLAVLLSGNGSGGGGEEEPTPDHGGDAQTEEPTRPELDPNFEGMSISTSCDTLAGGNGIQAVDALDEFTVRFRLCSTDPAFLEKVAIPSFHILPSEIWEATGGGGDLLERPIGAGPYMVSEWNHGDSIVFSRFADYWNDDHYANRPETLVIRWSSDSDVRLLELQAGAVDGIDNPSLEDYDVIGADPNLALLTRPATNTFYLGMTNTFAPFDDVRVRLAIAKGIDRQRIVDNFYPPGSEVATHFTPCSVVNGCAGEDWYAYDPESARALLAEAGYPDGFETAIYYRDVIRTYLPEPTLVARDLQAQLADLGIRAEVVVMESGEFIDRATNGQLDGLHLLGWFADYPHITNFLDFHFGRTNLQFGEPHPNIYQLLEQGFGIADPDEARQVYAEANNAIREEAPMVPIAHAPSAIAYSAAVGSPQASPLADEWFAASTVAGSDALVFMQTYEPVSLFCYDETDGESLRACRQVTEGLYAFEIGGTRPEPALATGCEPSQDLTEWTCTLRSGVQFHDGSYLDANDVVMSFEVGLDASNPYHVGNTGAFAYWDFLWGLWNAP